MSDMEVFILGCVIVSIAFYGFLFWMTYESRADRERRKHREQRIRDSRHYDKRVSQQRVTSSMDNDMGGGM